MPNLLLDEQISRQVAKGLRRQGNKLIVSSMVEWQDGRFMGQPDDLLLQEAAAQKFSLVTYDCKTVPLLLKVWAEAGRDHRGVIFVDNTTIPSSDFGGLIRALRLLCQESADWDWTNRVCFLRR
jgi:hypothetical protein